MRFHDGIVLSWSALVLFSLVLFSAVLVSLGHAAPAGPAAPAPPNIILVMADDLGWGDTGYNGNPRIQTPHLDRMARAGVRFDRWYANSPVCSPTRGGCMTGRYPYRYGVFFANTGHMRPAEVTLAEVLRAKGYATGHFGKWHLGTLTRRIRDSNRGGPAGAAHFSPPWQNGFDRCFSTEAKVPTWDPMLRPVGQKRNTWWDPITAGGTATLYDTYYWDETGAIVTENLRGDDSRIIMDRAIPLITQAVARGRPLFAVIWLHAPHLPVVAGPKYQRMYADCEKFEQHYFGCVTALDEQVGRLRSTLRDLGVAENTMLWFSSDNGPEGKQGRSPGSAGDFRGRKRSLFEGGVRVPGLLEWPARLQDPRVIDAPCCTLDYFPTVMAALGHTPIGSPEPLDGINLLPILEGRTAVRGKAIGFESHGQVALTGDRYKIYSNKGGKTFMLFDLIADSAERHDIAAEHPEIVARMSKQLSTWRASCKRSLSGEDYPSTSQ